VNSVKPRFRIALLCGATSLLLWHSHAWLGRATEQADGPGATAIVTAIDVQPGHLLASPISANWTSYNGDYSGRRFSSLDQITPVNISALRADWIFHIRGASDLEVTPAVFEGIMLVTAANDAYALDARTGRAIWHYSRPITEGLVDDAALHHNRGVALWRDRAFLLTDNAHLLCLDARSGHLRWDVAYAPQTNKNYGATGAPLVVGDKVLVGTSGGDDGVRGFLAAYDANSGKQAWRFWTIPAPGEPHSKSWPGDLYLRGGGTTWMPGTYDPELNLLYWTTSNPAPDFDGGVRPGDDLYTNCVLALDPDTGKLRWYFQFTPHDLFDYDATETPVLVDADYQGHPRKLILQANRNGFVYVLDRTDGKFLSALRFVDKLNWAKEIGADGRPVLTGIHPTPEGAQICPGFSGATNWYAPSYSPATHLLYFLALEDCGSYVFKREAFTPGHTLYATGVRRSLPGERQKILLAYNLDTNSMQWRYPQIGEGDSSSGTLSTAGGLVFFGDDSESFEAVEASSGKPLWHFTTGQRFHASPMSYAIAGKQYVAIAAGSDIFSFTLP
jgi:alcohol dehydrogenase (cytochrome c)